MVLVIIGLLVGAILTGQSLIDAAAQRAQVSQISKYNAAVHTFQTKYGGYLPGDIPDPTASNFGFAGRGPYAAEGDGNGLIQGIIQNAAYNEQGNAFGGETLMFWVDLSWAQMIDAGLNSATSTGNYAMTSATVGNYLPTVKLGTSTYVYVTSGGYVANSNGGSYGEIAVNQAGDNTNYFCVAVVTGSGGGTGWNPWSAPGMTVMQAYNIDKKIDDGLPQSGGVMAFYGNNWSTPYTELWAAGTGAGASSSNAPTTVATPGSISTCYDNNNTAGAVMQYSIGQNNGKSTNCALSFRFQ
jgi:hypothetical protein